MSEIDPANSPGLYSYCFSQSLIQEEIVYTAYFKHDYNPFGFITETHSFISSISGSGDIRVYESEPETR